MKWFLTGVAVVVATLALAPTPAAAASAPSPDLASNPFTHDFNNDGYSDLAIGVPYATVGAFVKAGAVEVIYGSINGLKSTGNELWTINSPGVPGKPGQTTTLGEP